MTRCSDETLEPGPVAALDLGDFDGTLEPPFATPIAQRFADSTTSWLSTLDAATTALELESALDVGGDLAGLFDGIGGGGATVVNAEANAHLQLAQAGFENARASIGEYKSWLPPDILPASHVNLLSFIVTDTSGARIPFARVTLDADFGHGTTFLAHDNGVALVEVGIGATVGWTVSADGHAPQSGVATATLTITAVRVTLA